MATSDSYDNLLNEAKIMYVSGHDNKYIEFQFADQGIDDSTIDKIVNDINILRKANKKSRGLKLIIYGASFIAVAFIITIFSFNSKSPIGFVMWGLAVSGVLTIVKGSADFLGL